MFFKACSNSGALSIQGCVQIFKYVMIDTIIHSYKYGTMAPPQGAYKLAWEVAAKPLQGEVIHAWYVKTESAEPLQLPRYFNVPLELAMSQWMVLRKKWDGALAKRASEGKSLTPASQKAYQAFLDAPYRKIVIDTKTKTFIPRPSNATTATLQNCLMMELKMSLDPSHLSLRFGEGPFFHLFVRQFEVKDAEAPRSKNGCPVGIPKT